MHTRNEWTGQPNTSERHVKHCANCSNRNANSTYCMIYGQPCRFRTVHQSERVVAKCTSVMYIIKLIVRFFFVCVCVCVQHCMCNVTVCPYLCQFFWASTFDVFFSVFSIQFSLVSFHQHNFQPIRSPCAIWTFNMHSERQTTTKKNCTELERKWTKGEM